MPATAASPAQHDLVLECQGVEQAFGSKRVLCDVNLKIARGQIVALVGPSGCGKSTLLRAILGTHPPQAGEITMNGERVVGPGRKRGIVYQRYSLFPFLTAQKNVAFGLMLDQTNLWQRCFTFWKWLKLRQRHLEESTALLDRLKLGPAVHQYPTEMSGGMCQRVAIAQALVMKPDVLLLDEPFGALDEATREEMQQTLLDLYQENLKARQAGLPAPYTILIVTHELNEAIYVADRVIGLSQYWDWQGEGLPASPGATVVYDAVSPVFNRCSEQEAAAYARQREELRSAVFDPAVPTRRGEFVRFWKEVEEGRGVGVMQR
ncbi:MAG: ABC transporter ATP-binding protein [Pirellulales bacterium]